MNDNILHVTSRPASRRRAGMRFTREVTMVPAASLTKAQLAALRGDPELSVTEVDAPKPAAGKAKNEGGKGAGAGSTGAEGQAAES